jgi:hypothetical protein
MRRCGTAFCVLTVGLLVAGLSAGDAFAAKGGQGKSHGQASHGQSGQGNGHAWAKGHQKHADAAPQLSVASAKPDEPAAPSVAAAKPKGAAPRQPGAQRHTAAKPARGADRRAEHLTICHHTGSGRYIVISPSVTGVMSGHFKHHDDFVYRGSCVPSQPDPTPASGGTPGSAGNPPAVHPNLPEAGGSPRPAVLGDLPFTGFPALPVFLAGLGLVAAGFALRRKPVAQQSVR